MSETAAVQRRTQRVENALRDAAAAGDVLILRGPATGDVFLRDGSTQDLGRLIDVAVDTHAEEGRTPVVYTPADGFRQCGAAPIALHLPAADRAPARAVAEFLRELTNAPAPVALIVDHADLVLPERSPGSSDERIALTAAIRDFAVSPLRGRGHRLVLVARSGSMDDHLATCPGFHVHDVGLPDLDERRRFVARLEARSEAHPDSVAPVTPGISADRVAELSGGLTLDSLLRIGVAGAAQKEAITADKVVAAKNAALRQQGGESLRVHNGPERTMSSIAGLPAVRLLLHEASVTGRFPSRVLLCGPPGTGKSLVVGAIAGALGRPAVSLGSYRSPWVGESERRIRAALDTLDSLRPVVLHIDEIDAALPDTTGPSADGGTSERTRAALWEWLSPTADDDGTLMVVATTNRPELLDHRLLDRFRTVPLLHPAGHDAADIITLTATIGGRHLDAADALQVVGTFDRLVTARALVAACARAADLADLEARGHADHISGEHLLSAFGELNDCLDADAHEAMGLNALRHTIFSSYLPWIAAQRLSVPYTPPVYVPPLLRADGSLDPVRLLCRLDELGARRSLARRGVS